MITSPRRSSLKLIFAGLSFIVSFFVIQSIPQSPTVESQILGANAANTPDNVHRIGLDYPVRLKIPSIGVDAAITKVGVTPNGTMDVPDNIFDVGWFDNGPTPGEKGSAVLAGHFNGANGEEGVFANLDKLKEGDVLYVGDDRGEYKTFLFRKSQEYSPGYADEVFSKNDKAHLNLITCNGVWDSAKETYNKRLVVFADLVL